mmetsp:Transcript_19919/g.28636  ORF Transcript_19919/g.28636 Transcript_19919/m.28636 type:complete len:135 (+) Transcript_19919:98-502(+)
MLIKGVSVSAEAHADFHTMPRPLADLVVAEEVAVSVTPSREVNAIVVTAADLVMKRGGVKAMDSPDIHETEEAQARVMHSRGESAREETLAVSVMKGEVDSEEAIVRDLEGRVMLFREASVIAEHPASSATVKM